MVAVLLVELTPTKIPLKAKEVRENNSERGKKRSLLVGSSDPSYCIGKRRTASFSLPLARTHVRVRRSTLEVSKTRSTAMSNGQAEE